MSDFDQMITSDRPSTRDIGVIAKVLEAEGLAYCDGGAVDYFKLAKTIIAEQVKAGMGTLILTDLQAHITAITDRYRAFPCQPIRGIVWRYTSPAVDGAQVLVRWEDGWQCAAIDPQVIAWEPDSSIPTWPGTFEQTEGE